MLKTTFALLAAGLFVTTVTLGSAQAADCKIATDAKTDVGKACKEGGVKEAKKVMKKMTRKAKKAGFKVGGSKVDCDSCHANEEDWKLTKDGKKQFEAMLKVIE